VAYNIARGVALLSSFNIMRVFVTIKVGKVIPARWNSLVSCNAGGKTEYMYARGERHYRISRTLL